LEFKITNNELVDLNLTDTIQSFTDMIYKQATKVGISHPQFDAKYVKRTKLKEYLPLSTLKLEPKISRNSRSESSSALVNDSLNPSQPTKKETSKTLTSAEAHSQSTADLNTILNNQQAAMSVKNDNTKETTNSINKGYLSPCSDSNDSLFTFNGQVKSSDIQMDQQASKTESDSDTSKPSDSTMSSQLEAASSDSGKSDETEIHSKSTSIKRSHSPGPTVEQLPFKKVKDDTEEMNTFNDQSPPVEEEEILDTLPPTTSNIQSLSNARLSTPPLAVVKNSIRVNIGCCTKK